MTVGAVVGFKMTMPLGLPAFAVMGTAALRAGYDIVAFGKGFAANGTGLSFIKKHSVTLSLVILTPIVPHPCEVCNDEATKFKVYLRLPRFFVNTDTASTAAAAHSTASTALVMLLLMKSIVGLNRSTISSVATINMTIRHK